MTVRVKLTLWYVCVLFASLALCTVLLYREWVFEPRLAREKLHREREQARALEEAEEKESGREKPHEKIPETGDDEVVEDLVENIYWIAIPAANATASSASFRICMSIM